MYKYCTHPVQKMIVMSNKFPRTFDSLCDTFVKKIFDKNFVVETFMQNLYKNVTQLRHQSDQYRLDCQKEHLCTYLQVLEKLSEWNLRNQILQ